MTYLKVEFSRPDLGQATMDALYSVVSFFDTHLPSVHELKSLGLDLSKPLDYRAQVKLDELAKSHTSIEVKLNGVVVFGRWCVLEYLDGKVSLEYSKKPHKMEEYALIEAVMRVAPPQTFAITRV